MANKLLHCYVVRVIVGASPARELLMSRVVVIGGSVGAINVLKEILSELPQDFGAAILIVTHIGSQPSLLPEMLNRISPMQVRHAVDGELITSGKVLVAPPDEHLMIVRQGESAYTRLVRGAKENHCRPAIDPLFRSAATALGEHTVGVLLSGYLDDGTVGLQAIKTYGGTVIVQDPASAAVPDMPLSAIKYVDADQLLEPHQIAPALIELISKPLGCSPVTQRGDPDASLGWVEAENLMSIDPSVVAMGILGNPSTLTCPECNGTLWEVSLEGPLRYRCHTGHAVTANVLEEMQDKVVEEALWGAIRALHDQQRLFSKLASKEQNAHHQESAADYQSKALEAQAHSQSLRDMIATRALISKRRPPGP